LLTHRQTDKQTNKQSGKKHNLLGGGNYCDWPLFWTDYIMTKLSIVCFC